jgi:hypothetical protein
MAKLYTNRDPEQLKHYDIVRPCEYTESLVDAPNCDQKSDDQFPITLPHRPVWIKSNTKVRNTETGVEWVHPMKIDAGWNYENIYWDPSPFPNVIYAVDCLSNLEEETKFAEELVKKRQDPLARFLVCANEWEEESDYLDPPQIKNRDMNDLFLEHCLKNPPKLKRQTNSPLTENYSWTDQRLDWMCMTVEEEDNEEKNAETFSQ